MSACDALSPILLVFIGSVRCRVRAFDVLFCPRVLSGGGLGAGGHDVRPAPEHPERQQREADRAGAPGRPQEAPRQGKQQKQHATTSILLLRYIRVVLIAVVLWYSQYTLSSTRNTAYSSSSTVFGGLVYCTKILRVDSTVLHYSGTAV